MSITSVGDCTHVVALNLCGDNGPFRDIPEFIQGDWAPFDALVASVISVRKIVVGFRFEQHAARFWKDVIGLRMMRIRTRLDVELECALLRCTDDFTPWGDRQLFTLHDFNDATGASLLHRLGKTRC